MIKIIRTIIIAAILIAPHFYTIAQDREISSNEIDKLKNIPTNYFVGLSFTNMVPQKEFFDNLPKSGQGFSIYGGYSADPMPLAFGLEFDFLFNGSGTKYRVINGKFPTIDVNYKQSDTVSTQSMVIPMNLYARIQPDIMGYISPYVEFIVGLSVMTLSENYNSGVEFFWNKPDTTFFDTTESRSSSAFHYGFGVGAMFKLVDFVGLPASHSSLNFDIRLRYLFGGEASYWKTDRVDFVNNKPVFYISEFKSKTDMIIFNAGLVFRF
ncbi:MAG: outer membrane beta-barrel protein [Ignavibacteriae bacterium]|nr:outer membrane beta-barrel protein [Ignavibacteriota bacterium]